jgi:hypothetical protein
MQELMGVPSEASARLSATLRKRLPQLTEEQLFYVSIELNSAFAANDLSRVSRSTKAVINLGCGDPVPAKPAPIDQPMR